MTYRYDEMNNNTPRCMKDRASVYHPGRERLCGIEDVPTSDQNVTAAVCAPLRFFQAAYIILSALKSDINTRPDETNDEIFRERKTERLLLKNLILTSVFESFCI